MPERENAMLRRMLEASFYMMGVVELPEDDSDIVHVYDSPGTYRFFDLPTDSMVGRSARELGVPPEVVAEWVRHYRASERLGREVRFEYPHPSEERERWLASVVAFLGTAETGRSRFSYVTEDITERKNAEQRLVDRETHLRLAMEASLSIAFEWEIATDRVRRLLSREEVLPATGEGTDTFDGVANAVHPDDRDVFRANVRRALVPGAGSYRSRHRVVRPGGEVRWHEETGLVHFDDRGCPVRLIGVTRDITEDQLRELALRRKASLVDLSHDAILAWSDQEGLVEWNAGAELLYGYTRAQALGREPHELLRTVPPVPLAQITEQLGRTGEWTGELRHRDAHGRELLVDSRQQAVFLEGQRVILESNRELTERQHMEEALRASEERFRGIAEALPGLVFVHDSEGQNTFVNREFSQFAGRPAEALLGRGWVDLVHHGDLGEEKPRFDDAFRASAPFEAECRLRRHDGVWRWFLVRSVPQRAADGAVRQWTGTAIDVTARRETEETLREADRRKDEFIAVLAHELRNPLAPVRTAVELLRLRGLADPQMERARQVIERQVKHMARLVDDLLAVSRLSRGTLELAVEACDLDAITRQTAEDYRSSLEAQGLEVVLRTGSPLWVEGDPVRLAQMIGNLLNNAGRFAERGGRVEVATSSEGGSAVVTVTDTGVGIDPSLLPRLFDPFSQADQGLARAKGGLGLGLALTKGLVQLHGGRVTAHSEGPGKGARFELHVPLSAEHDRALETDTSGAGASPALRVLVVEDNEDAAHSLRDLLDLWGHEVRVAYDGASAIALAKAFRPHVVLSDLGLHGEVDGYGVARALRRAPETSGSLLIALSGYADAEARRRSAEAGFDDHFAKPPDLAKIEAALAAIVAR